MKVTTITVPENINKLSELFNINSEYGDTLPKNCLFDKVTTGCGGTYVALHSTAPTIIAVPTKALVLDKTKQDKYKELNILGISSDMPFKSIPKGCTKIICTYQSLPIIASKLVMKNWNLVIDEMHLLTRMLSFSKQPLNWLLNNFREFNSYCFMSATIPKHELLLNQLKEIDRVTLKWSNLKEVSFDCLYSENIENSMLQIISEHIDGTREGNAYFFYNSIEGICKLIRTMRKKEITNCFSAMVSQSSYTKDRIRRAGGTIKLANEYNKVNFVTSANFEGVDFYDKEGVTYIISDSKHEYTKYSIVTTIPQIVGRLRDSIYNDKITIIFDNKEIVENKTEKDVIKYIEYREIQAKGLVDTYYEVKPREERYKAALALLKDSVTDPYVDITNKTFDIEDSFYIEPDLSFDIEPSENARISELELYDLMTTRYYINSSTERTDPAISLSDTLGEAPILSTKAMELFKSRSHGLKTLCNIYTKDPIKCEAVDPEWYDIIHKLGVKKIETCGYVKSNVKAVYEHVLSSENNTIKFLVQKAFTIDNVYPKFHIKNRLIGLGLNKAKANTIGEYFVVQTCKDAKGNNCFKIISKK